jgi:hypothetical protein
VLRSTVDLAAHRSTTDSGFQTPSTVLLLTVGGGGGGVSGMVTNKCTQIYGHHDSAQMDGLQAILNPLDHSSFNDGGGGVQMRRFFRRALSQRVIYSLHQTSSAPNHLLFTTLLAIPYRSCLMTSSSIIPPSLSLHLQ